MKNINLIHLIIPLLFLACTNVEKQKAINVIHFDSGFSLYQDTISFDIKGDMTHALKYHDKFYVLFEQRVLKYGGQRKRWLYIFFNGKVKKIVDCPEKMDVFYLDFFVKNDSIILKPYMDDKIYYFNTQNFTWKEIDKADDLIFEDEKFDVYSLDFGEWGGKTWFKDKKTGIEYEIESKTPLINKIDTTYYLTSAFEILKIENPFKLNKCLDNDITYENIETSEKFYSWHGNPIGFEKVYTKMDTIQLTDFTCILPQEINIISSFVWQNELLHIYGNDTATYIAKAENNSIKLIQKIKENLSFYNEHRSYRCRNLNKNNELLKFRTENKQLFGLMEIVDNNIHIHYFANNAELDPKSLGTAKSDSIFIERLNLILENLGNLKLKDVDLAEQKWKIFDITPNHKIGVGDSWNPNKYEIDTCKSYLIQEDSLISNSIIYYSTKANDLVRTIIIDWEKTDFLKSFLEKTAKETFKKKLKFLEDCITQKVGKPIESKSKENYAEKVWQTSNGAKIELENMKNFNRIRLVIYKN